MTDKYDLSGIDSLPAAPTSAPSKYDLGGIDAMPAASGFDKTAALFAASIGNPGEEAEKRRLESDIARITGFHEPVADIKDATRRRQQLEADHVTRASPRTSLFLSAPENAAVAIQDAKTMAQIEAIIGGDPLRSLEIAAKRMTMSTGAVGAKVGFDFPAVATDIIGESLRGVGVSDEYNVFKAMSASARRQAVATRNAIEYFTPEARNIVERAAASAGESAGMSLQLAPLAAMTPQGAGMAAAFGLTTFAESYTKAREAGKGPLDSLRYAIPQGAFEGLFEMAPAAFLADAIKNAPGLRQFTLGLIGKEIPTELATTLSQNLNDWVTFNPGKSVSDFIAEQPEALAETAIATVMGAGIQAGLIHGAQRVTGQFQVMQEERRIKQQQEVLQKLFEQAKNIKSDPVTFKSFMDGVSDNATVFVNADDLQQVLAQNNMGIDVLPTAAEMLAQGPSVTGDVEIPVSELMTAFAGTPAQEQIVQHTRVRQDDLSQAQWEQMGGIGTFLKSQTKEVQERQAKNEQFQSELDEIEAKFTGQLPGVPNISTAGYGTRDQQMVGRMVRQFYAVAADRMGVSPKQLAEMWQVKFPGAEQVETAPALTQGFDHGKPMVNIGLDIGDKQNALSKEEAIAMLQKLGVTVTDSNVVNLTHDWGKENTLIAHLDKPLTPEQMTQLMADTQQEAIPQYEGGVGTLYHATPEAAAKWGPFNPEYFRDLQGVSLLDARKTKYKAVDINTPEFKAWFAGGKVVNADGTPRVLYHGTQRAPEGISEFKPSEGYAGQPPLGLFWLTDSADTASGYADWLSGAGNPTVYPVYAALKTPASLKDYDAVVDALYKEGHRVEPDPEMGLYDPRLVAGLKAAGFDGITWTQEEATGTGGFATDAELTVVAFSPTQIKSAISNTGQFQGPNILEQAQSARTPTSKKGEDSLGPNPLLIDYKKIEDDKNAQNMALVGKYPGVRFKARNTDKRVEEFIQHLTDNLLWLHDQIPAEIRQRSKLWYDGANVIANRWTEKYDISLAQAAAVLAVYSPQKDWFTNVSLAERTLDIVREHQTTPWSDEMAAWFEAKDTATRKAFDKLRKNIEGKALSEIEGKAARNAWISAYKAAHDKELPAPKAKWDSGMSLALDAKKEIEYNKYPKLRALVEGKTLSELPDNYAKAVWLRARDEAHNDRRFRTVTPEGGFTTFITAGEAAMLEQEAEDTDAESETGAVAAWGSYATIEKALDVLADGSPTVISGAIGKKHKVRSFYNNIFDPGSDLGFVTIDTHAVAAGLLRPLSGNDIEASQNFGSAGSAKSAATGMEGTYAYYQEAYRRAAEARGLLPREMQSITWEAVRELYTMPFKHKKSNGKKVDELWTEYSKGKRDAESVRSEILKLAGGVEKPAWVGHDSGLHEGGWASSYTGELLGAGVAGRQGAAAARAGTGAAGGDSELAQRADAVQRAAGAVAGPVVGIHFSKAPRTSLASSAYGTGAKGAEAERLATATDPRIKQRVAFYVNTGQGLFPEEGVGSHAHMATLRKLYDADADALKIWRNAGQDMNAAESAVLDAGFDGYLTRNFGRQGTVVMLGSRSVDVQSVKREDVNTTAEQPPSPEIPKMKQAAMAILQNRALPFGQQSVESWKRDLERTDPDTAALIAWDKIPAGDYYKDQIAARLWQPAYHGTAVRGIKKFSTAFMGTGEGVQAFGWGLYFASDKAIADFYREQLTGAAPVKNFAIGSLVLVRNETFVDYSPKNNTPEAHARATASEYLLLKENEMREALAKDGIEGAKRVAREELDWLINEYGHAPYVPEFKALRRYIDSGKLFKFELAAEEGQIYQVDIPEHDEYLDWDKPLSEQSTVVQAALEKISGEEKAAIYAKDYFAEPSVAGGSAYEMLAKALQSAEAASRYLNTLGIAGVRYKDANSRGAQEGGSYNYVVFNDDAIRIIDELYQEPPALFAEAQQRRGSFNPLSFELRLTEHANRTTLIHELSHFFMAAYIEMAQQPNAPAELTEFVESLLGYLFKTVPGDGVRGLQMANTLGQKVGAGGTASGPIPEGRTNIERWNAMTLDQQRPYWEHFAEQWEQYAMTGKAPTKALQSAFTAFAKWMKSVYQSFKNFLLQNPQAKPLDPEITQYFDRMLATEAELEAAREERGYKALFKAAADAGMSPSQFADYMALDELQKTEANELLLSRSLRDMKWLSNAKSKAIKELQAEADELRALVRAGVEEELADTPIRKAERWLRKGEMVQDGEQIKATAGFKLNAEIVKAMFPQGAVDSVDLAKLKQMMSSTGTQHPDDVAAIFGFRNGETMVRELLELQPFKDEAQQLTDIRMLEEHGDLATPAAIEKAADAAIHNAAHLKMVATEVWALNNRIGSVAALTKAAKEFAKNLIGNTTVKKLSPSSYANAATRAGKMASRAVAKKETDVAAREKRMEMINAAAAKEAYAAEAEVRAMINRLRKIAAYSDKHSSVTSREFSVVQAVRAILGEFEIGSKGEKAQTYVATVSEYDPMLGARLKEVIDVLTASPKPWAELTVDELRELHTEIGGLWTVAREIRTVELAGEKMTLDEARQQLLDKLSENRKAGKDGKAFSLTDAEIRSQDFMSFVARGVRPESWISMKDGNEQYGPWRRLIWNAIDRAQLGYNADKADKLKQLKALLETVAADMKDVQIDAPELGGTFGAGNTIGYSELLHAILHTGNESNKTKLLVGRGWGGIREDGTLDSTKWDAFMKRMWAEGKITKTHMDFVQGVWDLMESMKEGAQKTHRATTGRYFEEIKATEIVTPFGTYRGGYVPAIVDRRLVADADVRKALEESQTDVLQTFEKPAGGFTKSRVKNYNSKLELNIAALGRHIDQVMLFTHMSVPVRSVQRVLRGKALSKELSEQDRSALTKVIMPWLHGAATQTVTERGSMSYENLELLTKARSRAGAALMFANISNSVQQLTGFFPAMLKVNRKELLFAAAKGWYKPRELAAHVSELSPYMKQRLDSEVHAMAEEIDHILLNPTRLQKAQDWASAHAYFLQMAVDSAMSPVIWQAKFNETISRGGSQQEAIDLADSAVRMTQGSNRAIDIAAMERGSPFYRLFMQFAGYFNTQINLVGEKLAAAKALPSVPAKYGRIGMVLWLGWLAPAIASALVVQLFRGGVEDDDDDGEWLDDWLTATLIGAPFKYAAAAVPVFGQTIVAAMNSFNDKPYDDRISMSPAVSIVEGGYRGGKALVGAFEDPTKAGRAIRDIGTFLSLFTGVPITPITKAVGYATDVETGKVSPTSGVDYGRGIVTGVASPESKR